MDLRNLTIRIRPRTPWEAIDLGLLMGRQWWWPMARLWLLLTAPLLVLSLTLPKELGWIGPTLYWWGKPLWERPLLYFLSQSIFAQPPSLRQSLRMAWPQLRRDALASLLWRRFSPERAFNAPVTVLEQLRGQARQRRLAVLSGRDATVAGRCFFVILHIEGFLLLATWLFLYMMLPQGVELSLVSLPHLLDTRAYQWINALTYWACSTAVAPFFVAVGFASYLNRRIWLEAWDIDIAFRQLAQRLTPPPLNRGLLSLLLALCLLAPMASPPSHAQSPQLQEPVKEQEQEQAPSKLTPELARQQAQAVLAGEDFHQKSAYYDHRWRWKSKEDPGEPNLRFEWLATALAAFAKVLEILLWILVLGLVAWVALHYRDLLARFGYCASAPRAQLQITQAFGLDLRPENLPADVAGTAWHWIQAGRMRDGLGLLYRASLIELLQRGLQIRDSDTEANCLQLLQAQAAQLQLTPSSAGYFTQLTHTWQRLAYGHEAPELPLAQQLCQGWPAAWARPQEPA
jgi:hypothetical protein